ncbi:MAG TPA: hypothetical protein VMS17_29610 [Gemmataceae bacterium]|nr:hypothetical protein [Gemmataceae bacterium]
MPTEQATGAPSITLTLTAEEQKELLSILEWALRDKHVEAHRTDAIAYKQYVEREESVLQRLVERLRPG